MWLEVGGVGINQDDVLQIGNPPNEIIEIPGCLVISGCHCWFEKKHFGTDMSFAQWMVAGRFADRVSIITPDVLFLLPESYRNALTMKTLTSSDKISRTLT